MPELPESSAETELSIVVATYNRAEVLDETLRRLDEQSVPAERYEVIVVDDGSSDDTAEVVAARKLRVTYELLYLRHDNHGPGYTQNVGIRAARSPLVLLIADDIWPSPDLVREHLDSHASYPEATVGVLGRVEQSPELPQSALHEHWDPFQYDRFAGQERIDGIVFNACNVSVKKAFLLEHGLFREHRGAAHEDIELGFRLSQRGLWFRYVPKALGYHHHPETLERICRRAYERGLNFGLLADNIPPEVIFPLYKIASLEAGVGTWARMLPRELLRWPLFNALTVETLWKPILASAETHPVARWLARPATYRGVAGHYLRAGNRQRQRLRRAASAPSRGVG